MRPRLSQCCGGCVAARESVLLSACRKNTARHEGYARGGASTLACKTALVAAGIPRTIHEYCQFNQANMYAVQIGEKPPILDADCAA